MFPSPPPLFSLSLWFPLPPLYNSYKSSISPSLPYILIPYFTPLPLDRVGFEPTTTTYVLPFFKNGALSTQPSIRSSGSGPPLRLGLHFYIINTIPGIIITNPINIGNILIHIKFINWSYLNLGKLALTHININTIIDTFIPNHIL